MQHEDEAAFPIHTNAVYTSKSKGWFHAGE